MKITYNRVCEYCEKGMNEGFIYEDETLCSLACLPISEEEWNVQYTDDSENYWTEWEDEPSEEAQALNERNS